MQYREKYRNFSPQSRSVWKYSAMQHLCYVLFDLQCTDQLFAGEELALAN